MFHLLLCCFLYAFFFFNDPATTEIYTLSLHDALPIYRRNSERRPHLERDRCFECKRFIATGAIGRCDWCFERRPAALALQVGKHRVEYLQEMLDALPAAQRSAVERSPNRIR